tara:strand:- start:625 stop:1890 length:1266 start_codon:yes stop_codon:yes gene_type:complete
MKKQSFVNAALIVFYKYLVDLSYIVTQERFEYAGLFKLSESLASTWLSWCLLILLLPMGMASFHRNTISARIVSILFLVSVVPTISLIGFRQDYSNVYILLIMIYWMIFLLAWNYLPKIIIYNRKDDSSPLGIYLITSVCSLAVIYVWARYSGFHIQTDLHATLYETRANAREFSIGTLMSYVWLSADNILPLCVVYFLYRKQYPIAIIISIIVFLNFSITATRQIIALLALGVLGYYFYAFISKGKFLLYAVIIIILITLLEPLIFGTYFVSLIPYRIFFIPGELHYSHFDFFQTNSVDYFAQGPLRHFVDSAYDKPIAFLIGEFSIGDISARANNGLFSDAYQNLGSLGVFIMPILTVLYLKLLDGATQGHDTRLFVVIFAYASFVLLGIPLTTALISSGLILLLVFLIWLPRPGLKKA